MISLRLIADDLTGALDSSAPFATPDSPVRILLFAEASQPLGNRIAVSTESRDLPRSLACERVVKAVEMLRPGSDARTLWFKKVDSVLRGHPVAETIAMARAGGFSHCLFAPAFPEMGRITRGGVQQVRGEGGEWVAAGPGNLDEAFRKALADGGPPVRITVPDIETTAQFDEACRAGAVLPHVLWVGSRGLAKALAERNTELASPPIGLFVVGTSHPATRAQAAQLSILIGDVPPAGPFLPSAAAPRLLDPVPSQPDGAGTRNAIAEALRRAERPGDNSAIFIAGGDTLAVVLDTIGAIALDCLGEVGKGLPMARILGGRFDSKLIVTKSGGFGDAELLIRLLRASA